MIASVILRASTAKPCVIVSNPQEGVADADLEPSARIVANSVNGPSSADGNDGYATVAANIAACCREEESRGEYWRDEGTNRRRGRGGVSSERKHRAQFDIDIKTHHQMFAVAVAQDMSTKHSVGYTERFRVAEDRCGLLRLTAVVAPSGLRCWDIPTGE
ncbi:uncharacterized protein PAC_08846 [Phialocephala subalpina]|uniref:Uncharacterized protein n=1 Tax=Phialocephala subalpina TaxID=576137 RepID=A0A1L7X1P5_9HELO|nr:uncharacterized protein PAC_08846 [Phialocephala subalpina]